MIEPKIDIFIAGETIDLCVAHDDDWTINQWYKWFNDSDVTTILAQGVYPNTPQKQREFLQSAEGNRLVLMIRPKGQDRFIGVVSLSSIDHINRQCDSAMVIGEKVDHPDAMYFGLEAKALITEHAFEKMGMERVNSSQVCDLIAWQRTQILFGFQIEGIQRAKMRKGYRHFDTMVSSCLLADYKQVLEERSHYWPGKTVVFKMLRQLPRCQAIENLMAFLKSEQQIMVEHRRAITKIVSSAGDNDE